jgi:hypothetical protein
MSIAARFAFSVTMWHALGTLLCSTVALGLSTDEAEFRTEQLV